MTFLNKKQTILTIVFWLAALNPDVEVKLLLLVGASIREPMGGPLVCWSALNCLQQYFFRHFFHISIIIIFSSNFFSTFFWSMVVTNVDFFEHSVAL
jgi:hypothetical protein